MSVLNNKQVAAVICSIILSAFIISIGIALSGGIWEYKKIDTAEYTDLTFAHENFNRFTGESLIMVSHEKTNFRYMDLAKRAEEKEQEKKAELEKQEELKARLGKASEKTLKK